MADQRIIESSGNNIDKSGWTWKFTVVEWVLAVSFVIFSLLFFILGKGNILTSDRWPEYGDFIGGILGTIVAYIGVKLLVKTLQSQERANKENAKSYDRASDVYDLQQFNEMFKLLFSEYSKSIQSYKMGNYAAGRESMHQIVEGLRNAGLEGIENGIFEELSKQSLVLFNNYYVVNHTVASMQFRILYRIFCLIESANISERRKTDIIKILRCQLSEDELILIRYNAMSSHGENMRRFINRYNILKHLPVMNLLEFSNPCTSKLSEVSRNCITTEFNRWRKDICKCFSEELDEDRQYEYDYSKRYKAKSTIQKDKKLFKFELTKYNNEEQEGKDTDICTVFDKFKVGELKEFLLNLFLDYFEYSNFKMLNNGEIKETTDIITSTSSCSDTLKIELKRDNYQIRCKSNNDDGPGNS